ncbi:hypothetical protein ACOSQ4_029975 [Xanthoceras sorbifolium]
MGLWPPQAMEDPEEGWAPSHNTAKWSGYYPDRICQDPLFVTKFDRVDYGSKCGYNAPGSKLGFLKRKKKKKNHSLSLFVLCLLILSSNQNPHHRHYQPSSTSSPKFGLPPDLLPTPSSTISSRTRTDSLSFCRSRNRDISGKLGLLVHHPIQRLSHNSL